jgi:quercetin dioxygenase-like cupin family protein
MTEHPHTIDNGGGEQLTFVEVGHDERGEHLEIRNSVASGAGPPMHVHHLQEEGLTVERGTMGYQVLGEGERRAGPGESATFAPGVGDRFWNAGDDELVCTRFVRPPDNLEYFLTEMYASMRRHGGKRPGGFDGAYLTRRYRHEFQMLDVPIAGATSPVPGDPGCWPSAWLGIDASAPEPVRRGASDAA